MLCLTPLQAHHPVPCRAQRLLWLRSGGGGDIFIPVKDREDPGGELSTSVLGAAPLAALAAVHASPIPQVRRGEGGDGGRRKVTAAVPTSSGSDALGRASLGSREYTILPGHREVPSRVFLLTSC